MELFDPGKEDGGEAGEEGDEGKLVEDELGDGFGVPYSEHDPESPDDEKDERKEEKYSLYAYRPLTRPLLSQCPPYEHPACNIQHYYVQT